MTAIQMEHAKIHIVNRHIRKAAEDAAAGQLSVPAIERFLRTGEEIWEGAGSGRFTLAQINQDGIYTQAVKTGMTTLFDLLAELLPTEEWSAQPVLPEAIRQRFEPMVRGLVQADWQEVALHELTRRTFILNFPGTKAAMAAEMKTCYLGAARQILWAFFEDHGLKPEEIDIKCDGLSAGEFAHVRSSALLIDDPYSDVVVHEAAHLLHYLKPEHYGLHVRRGQERFVDVEFRHRELFAYACEAYSRVVLQGERRKRISFADKMRADAFSFARDEFESVVELVIAGAAARNGWRVIRKATVISPIRRRPLTIAKDGPAEIWDCR